MKNHASDTVNSGPGHGWFCTCNLQFETKTDRAAHIKAANSAEYGKQPAPTMLERNQRAIQDAINNPPIFHRTEDYTLDELFGRQEGTDTTAGVVYLCTECGALIISRTKHAQWHNKLLP